MIMKPINDINHLSNLIKQTKEALDIDTSNFFLMPDSINNYISENRMCWEKNSNGLIIICEEIDFYYFYFFLSTQVKREKYDWIMTLQKPIIIDLVFNESTKPSSIVNAENYWMDAGFKLRRVNRRMTIRESAINRKNKTEKYPLPEKYYLYFAKPEDTANILKLWREYLDRYTLPLPDYERLSKLINEKSVIGAYDKNGIIIAALQMNNAKNVSSIDFLAVDKNNRRQGLAQALIDFYLAATENINRYYLWVNIRNTAAIKLYENKGYIFDGKMNRQLIFP